MRSVMMKLNEPSSRFVAQLTSPLPGLCTELNSIVALTCGGQVVGVVELEVVVMAVC